MAATMCTCALLFIFSAAITASGHQFEVGGEQGWTLPTGNDTETYIEWAEHHRFHIGDTLYFRYQNDTLLLVNKEDYESCNASSPIETFGEGGAIFKFDRHGFFYFISPNQENCEAGQKLIVRVMVQNVYHPSGRAPAPSPGGLAGGRGGSDVGMGPTAFNSAGVLSVTSYLMTTVAGVFLVLYLFM